jgi:hypothetical protein
MPSHCPGYICEAHGYELRVDGNTSCLQSWSRRYRFPLPGQGRFSLAFVPEPEWVNAKCHCPSINPILYSQCPIRHVFEYITF